MRLTPEKVQRIAERLSDELAERGLLEYRPPDGQRVGEARTLRIRAIAAALSADLAIEDEIDAEVERILDSYSRTLRGTERDVLFRKHKEEVARRRRYTL